MYTHQPYSGLERDHCDQWHINLSARMNSLTIFICVNSKNQITSIIGRTMQPCLLLGFHRVIKNIVIRSCALAGDWVVQILTSGIHL